MATKHRGHWTSTRFSRRTFLAGSAALGAAPLLLKVSGVAAQATPGASPAAAASGPPEAELEIFSWWTTGGEAAGLEQFFKAFSAKWPNVKIINAAVAGGAGSNAKVALQTRLSGHKPPDSWQSHPGEELFSLYVEPGYCLPIDELYQSEGWNDVIPKGLIDQVTKDGKKYLIPTDVHRGNVMFYNKKVLSDNGITVGDTLTFDDFFKFADQLKAKNIPALCLGSKDSFATPMLFENNLLGVLGPDDYTGLWNGKTDWGSDGVKQAVEDTAKMFDYLNPDHAALTWDGAVDEVIEGKGAFTSMGDWAWGEVVAKKGTDAVAWATHPGTKGAFVAVVDGFTLPKDAPHPNNAQNWLRTVGSAPAQEAFAPFKGCIPARTDANVSKLPAYSQWSAKAFTSAPVVPSMAHGAAASPQWQQSIFDATTEFLVSKDTSSYIDNLKQAASDALSS